MSGLKINTLNPDWPKMIAIAASSQIDHPQLDLFDGHFFPTMGWLFFFGQDHIYSDKYKGARVLG